MDGKNNEKRRTLAPRASVAEHKDGKITCILEMPGVKKEDLDIRIESSHLTIVGKREVPKDFRYLLNERRNGDYVQTYTLDETVDQSKVDARLDKGILTLTLELKDHVKPRAIKVRAE